MANYITIGSRFKPYSYEEYLAPVQQMTEAHEALENEYGDLMAKSSVWEQIANEQQDSYAYSLYKAYANDLANEAERLSKEGLTPSSRQNMLKMKQRYSSDIIPIEQAYKRRQELADEQRKYMQADPSIRYERQASTMSLDDFIKNPSADYGRGYSGQKLMDTVSKMASNYSRELTDTSDLTKLGIPYQYIQSHTTGATSEDLMQVLASYAGENPNSKAATFLKGMVDQAIYSSGVADWADKKTLKEFYNWGFQGLYSAIGKTDTKHYTDSFGMQLDLQRRREEGKNTLPKDTGRGPEPEETSSMFNLHVPRGVEGNIDENLARIKGSIRRSSNNLGVSTETLDNAESELKKAERALKSINITDDEIAKIREYDEKAEQWIRDHPAGGESIPSFGRKPSKYDEYHSYLQAKERYNREYFQLEKLKEDYGYISDDPMEAISMGIDLETSKSKIPRNDLILWTGSTSYGKVRDLISNAVSNATEDDPNLYLVDADGKKQKYKVTEEIRDKFKSGTGGVFIRGGKNPKLSINLDGKEYSIKGIKEIDDFNNELAAVANHLGDFTANRVKNRLSSVSPYVFMDVLNKGENSEMLGQLVALGGVKASNIEGTPYQEINIQSTEGGDIIKIIIDKRTKEFLAINSLSSELGNGELRAGALESMGNAMLNRLVEDSK